MKRFSDVALSVYAKAPVAGQAKTRLIPALGADGAAALAARLLVHAVQQALGTGCGHIELCVTPTSNHPAFQRLKQEHGMVLEQQGEGDLGERMAQTLERLLQHHDKALLMGTDAPTLDTTTLRRAADALETHDAVFVPAIDGGYALVGLRRSVRHLFHEVPWSTPQVMAITRQRAREAQVSWFELDAVPDIDEPQDLIHLPSGWVT